jgi:ABC-type multidrug transport system ATPase subunit
MILVDELVKKYEKADPDAQAQDLNASVRSDRPLEQQQDDGEAPKGTIAVKGTSFGVKSGECFALLGVNGAGKSSTFNCLTANDTASGGSVML